MEGKVLAGDLIRNPADWYQSIFRHVLAPLFPVIDESLSVQRYTASSVVLIAYGRRIVDTRTDVAYQKLMSRNELLLRVNVPGAQCENKMITILSPVCVFSFKLWYRVRDNSRSSIPAIVSQQGKTTRNRLSPFEPCNPRVARRRGPGQDGGGGRTSQASILPDFCLSHGSPSPDTNFLYSYWASYAKQLLEQREKYADLDDHELNSQPGSVFSAGVDTTSATLQSLVLALVLHPDVQEKAHEEMDRVVGQMRSPTWKDEPQLPYLQVGELLG
jgi:Cytochrome P450